MSEDIQPPADWSQPREVDRISALLGAGVTRDLLPRSTDIPAEFWRDSHPWAVLMHRWFFDGLPGSFLRARDGIVWKTAVAHLAAIMRSSEPRHEHKIAGAAYLCSLWFHDPVMEESKPAARRNQTAQSKPTTETEPQITRSGARVRPGNRSRTVR